MEGVDDIPWHGLTDDWDEPDIGMFLAEAERHHRSRLQQARRYFLPTRYPKPRRATMAKPQRETLKSPLFRGSFVYLAKPRTQDRDDGTESEKYQMTLVLPKGKKSTKEFIGNLEKLLLKTAKEKHGDVPKNKLKHWPIKDGDNHDNEQFAGHWLIQASSNFKPSVIDTNGDELTTEDELYSGAWYKAKISAWAWANKKSGKGVSVNLESAIKMKDDKRFGGGSDAKDDFADEVSESEDGDEDTDLTA